MFINTLIKVKNGRNDTLTIHCIKLYQEREIALSPLSLFDVQQEKIQTSSDLNSKRLN